MRTRVEIVDEDGLGPDEEKVAALAQAVLESEDAEAMLAIVYVDEPTIADLNRRYRGLDEPTDVLAFSEREDGGEWPDLFPDLGEVVVCPQVVLRYAEEDEADPGRRLGWTIVHGILHLLGYDHERDEGEMRRRELELLGELECLLAELSPVAET